MSGRLTKSNTPVRRDQPMQTPNFSTYHRTLYQLPQGHAKVSMLTVDAREGTGV